MEPATDQQILELQRPMARDLRFLFSALKISNDRHRWHALVLRRSDSGRIWR